MNLAYPSLGLKFLLIHFCLMLKHESIYIKLYCCCWSLIYRCNCMVLAWFRCMYGATHNTNAFWSLYISFRHARNTILLQVDCRDMYNTNAMTYSWLCNTKFYNFNSLQGLILAHHPLCMSLTALKHIVCLHLK